MTIDSLPADSDTVAAPDLLSLTRSLFDAQALLTGLELDLFTTLHSMGPADAESIRSALGLPGRGLSTWLDLLVCNGLLQRDAGRYRNTQTSERYLVRGNALYIGDVLRLRAFPCVSHLTESLRTGVPHSGKEFMNAVEGLDVLRQFANSMDHMADPLIPSLLEVYDGWNRYRSVLDIGGCRGHVLSHILLAHPHLQGHVFDLPMVAPFLEENRSEHGLDDRLNLHSGDFFSDPLPSADIAIIGHALVNWDADQQSALISKAYDSINPGGVLLVYDPMLAAAPGHVDNHALKVGLSMLVMTKGGRTYTSDELRAHATAAGFATIDFRPLGAHDTLAICHKPAP